MVLKLQRWHVRNADGEEVGPLELAELRERIQEGRIPLDAVVRNRTDGQFLPLHMHPQWEQFLSPQLRHQAHRLWAPPVPAVTTAPVTPSGGDTQETPEEEAAPVAPVQVAATAPPFSPKFQPVTEVPEVQPKPRLRNALQWHRKRLETLGQTLAWARGQLWVLIPIFALMGVLAAFLFLRYPSQTQILIGAGMGVFAGWFFHNPHTRPKYRARKPIPAPEFRSVTDILDYNARCAGEEVVRETRRKRARRRARPRIRLPRMAQFLLCSLIINGATAAVYLPLAWKMHFAFGCTFRHYLYVAFTFGAWEPMVVFVYAAVIFLHTAAFWIIFVVRS